MKLREEDKIGGKYMEVKIRKAVDGDKDIFIDFAVKLSR